MEVPISTDASGNYTLPGSDLANGQTADATVVQEKFDDIEAGLTERITKTGKTTYTANQPMGGFRHTGAGAATARTDYARADQVIGGPLSYAADTGTADAIALAPSPGISAYAVGLRFRGKKIASPNATTTPTAAINGLTAGTITWPDGSALVAGDLPASCLFELGVASATPTFHLLTPAVPVVWRSGAQTIAGVKTFSSSPVIPTPAAGTDTTAAASAAFVQAAVAAQTAVADTNVAPTDTSRTIVFTSLTAARSVTLPAASGIKAGRRIAIIDGSGSASETNAISLVPNGTDTIAGSNTTQVCINIPRGSCVIVCNGSNGWDVETWSVRYVNTLSGDVALNNTANYFTGPTVAQGTVGTWRAYGSTTVTDTAGAARLQGKLWDGTTVADSGEQAIYTTSAFADLSFSGIVSAPAGNIRISCKDATSTSGAISFNASGNSKDSTLTVERIA